MHRPAGLTEDHGFRLLAALSGLTLTGAALSAADLAREHAATLDVVCGVATQPHCGWCYGAAALGLAALTAFVAALQPGCSRQVARQGRRPR